MKNINKKSHKEKIVKDALNCFNTCEAVLIFKYKNFNVSMSQSLRRKIFKDGGRLVFVKNTLLRIVAKTNSNAENLIQSFKEKIAIVFSFKNTNLIASSVKEFVGSNSLTFNSGLMSGKVLSPKRFDFLSNIPSEKALQANLCFILKMPMAKLVYCLNEISELKKKNEGI